MFLFLLLLLEAEARLSSPEGEALVHQEPVQPPACTDVFGFLELE